MDISNHTIIKYLKSFSKKDIKMLQKMLSSPYFNNRRFVNDVFYEISKMYRKFEERKLNSEFILLKISKDLPVTNSSFRVALSLIQKLIQKYLIDRSLNGDYFTQKHLLIYDHFKYNRIESIAYELINLKNFLKLDNVQEEDYFYKKYQLTEIEAAFRMANFGKIKKNVKNNFKPLKFVLLDNFVQLTNFYVSTIINNYINVFIYKYYDDDDITIKKIQLIIDKLNLDNLIKATNISNDHYYFLELVTHMFNLFKYLNEIKYFEFFKIKLHSKKKILTKYQKYIFYSSLINYCYIRGKEGKLESYFTKEIFYIFQEYLKEKLYLYGPTRLLDFVLFRIIIDKALQFNKVDCAEGFTRTYHHDLMQHLKQDGLNYGLTLANIYKGNYCLALESLMNINFKPFSIWIRQLKIILFYKLDYIEEGKCEINSFLKYLKSRNANSISSNIANQNAQIFLKYIIRLYKIDYSSKREIELYVHSLQTEKDFFYKHVIIKCVS